MNKIIFSILSLVSVLMSHAAVSDTISVPAKFIKSPMHVTVITPDKVSRGEKCPTVYMLNGYGGDHRSWGLIQPRLEELSEAYGMILVMPDGRDSWYWDSPERPEMKMESFFIKELVPYIDSRYPTEASADKRAITGLSMGGHGALWLAIRHSDVFGNAGSTSGGVNILPFTGKWKMKNWLGEYGDNPDRWKSHTVINLVPNLKPGQLNIIFDCGSEDFFAGVNADLHKALSEANIPHDYISRPGNHSQAYWRNSILYQLLYFNGKFND